jgi:hypothetical protein
MDEEVCASSPPYPGAISVDDVCIGICGRFALVQRVSETDEQVLWTVYIWAEGARYEGEYKEDKKNGRGVQTWPSGAR